jgi:hypothetical protein
VFIVYLLLAIATLMGVHLIVFATKLRRPSRVPNLLIGAYGAAIIAICLVLLVLIRHV